jgi:adenine-specific DNA-methyltransferase
MDSTTADIESRRRAATQLLDASHRSQFGQYFTPAPVAQFMASLFQRPRGRNHLSILDPGAGIGIGSLSAALLSRLKGRGCRWGLISA